MLCTYGNIARCLLEGKENERGDHRGETNLSPFLSVPFPGKSKTSIKYYVNHHTPTFCFSTWVLKMNTYYEETSEHKDSSIDNKAVTSKEKSYNEDNYVFVNEKYREYFDNISDIFEEKIDYILKKHFKKNEPTDKNKLLCLNVCVSWRKTFLQLLSKTLNEYDEYTNENKEKNRNTKEDELDVKENIIEIKETLGKIEKNKDDIKKEKNILNENNNDDKDLKSYIKNVKVVDNKNIEVIYDDNDIFNDSRPSAELSTDEIYYLLVESKKSENEFKKKIYTFLKYLPLFIRSIENKNLMEKKILEEKLLLNSTCNDNVLVHGYTDNLNMYEHNFNINTSNTSNTRLSVHEIKNKLDTIVNFNCNLSENLENVFKRGISLIDSQNGRKFCPSNFESINISDGEMIKHNKFGENTNSGEKIGQNGGTNGAPVEDVNGGRGRGGDGDENENFNNMEDNSKNFFNIKNNKSLILPLSRVNDLSLINNISTKSINEIKDEHKENETSLYIYKSNMNELNVYGLDILINVNNTLKNKINHIYSLIQFYTMLAQDVFNDS
ncbi:conserved Plasmodium protein, unknown function [Plasmodium ovale curtisi]|uniref:Uncharacterized protein n=1 Tax=Plasmodium ovale curtisi TaxID=864141 RepID=A0A1A8WQS5_PLAOA|nr:conserved Plasmodium protein, unknown function [Plasmodium ovale curtisi]